MRRTTIGGAVAALLLTTLVAVSALLPLLPGPAHALGVGISPVFDDDGGAPDPSVVGYAHHFIEVGTGVRAPRLVAAHPQGPWVRAGQALKTMPAWASGDVVWAADLVRDGDRWLLYFAAPVAGLGHDGRCIGVAVARSPLGHFRPVGTRPLVCPPGAHAPQAFDDSSRVGTGLPTGGVIDPSAYVGTDGRRYLLYRTQNFPASIRILRLPADGRGRKGRGTSSELVRSAGAIENPVLVRRHAHWVLFTSEGYYGGCGYHTTWRISAHLHDWSASPAHLLVPAGGGALGLDGLCGTGGADVAALGGRPYLYFNSWRCRTICPHDLLVTRDHRLHPHRALYAARLRWTTSQAPAVAEFLHP